MSTPDVITFVNPSEHTIKLGGVGLPDVAPGKTVDVPLGLAAPTIRDNGRRGPSQIEKIAPQLKPKDPEEAKAWLETPAPLPPKSLKVTVTPRPGDEPAGVVALRKAKAAIAEKAAAAAADKKPATPNQTPKA